MMRHDISLFMKGDLWDLEVLTLYMATPDDYIGFLWVSGLD